MVFFSNGGCEHRAKRTTFWSSVDFWIHKDASPVRVENEGLKTGGFELGFLFAVVLFTLLSMSMEEQGRTFPLNVLLPMAPRGNSILQPFNPFVFIFWGNQGSLVHLTAASFQTFKPSAVQRLHSALGLQGGS